MRCPRHDRRRKREDYQRRIYGSDPIYALSKYLPGHQSRPGGDYQDAGHGAGPISNQRKCHRARDVRDDHLEKMLADEDIRGRLVQTIPLRRFGRPREVGLLAVYLAAEASDYMTGQTLYIDGGYTVA